MDSLDNPAVHSDRRVAAFALGLGPIAAAVTLIADRLNLPPDIAAEVYATATDPVTGLATDAACDIEGFKTVLRLRAPFEGSEPSPPEKYLDLSYHRRALAGL